MAILSVITQIREDLKWSDSCTPGRDPLIMASGLLKGARSQAEMMDDLKPKCEIMVASLCVNKHKHVSLLLSASFVLARSVPWGWSPSPGLPMFYFTRSNPPQRVGSLHTCLFARIHASMCVAMEASKLLFLTPCCALFLSNSLFDL